MWVNLWPRLKLVPRAIMYRQVIYATCLAQCLACSGYLSNTRLIYPWGRGGRGAELMSNNLSLTYGFQAFYEKRFLL